MERQSSFYFSSLQSNVGRVYPAVLFQSGGHIEKGQQLPQRCPEKKKDQDGKEFEIRVLCCTHQRMEAV